MTVNGELVPNRIFVGNLPLTTTDTELLDYFGKLTNSHLKEAKIITDPKGLSKGYGFITFDNENEVNKVLNLSTDTLIFKESKLNVANAYKRKQFIYNSYNQGTNNYSNNQIESERLFMSPNNSHALNLMSPTPPSHLNGKQSPTDNDLNNQDEMATTSSVEQLDQNDMQSPQDDLKADIQQDNNNNNTVPVKQSFNKLSRNYSNESSNIDSPVSINPVNDTATFNKKEYRQNNQRNYNNSSYRFNQFNQQQNRNQIVNQLTIQTPQPGQQLQHQQQTPGQYVNGQNYPYFYAMAAGINSPVQQQQQQILLQNSTNKQVQYINNTNYRNKNKNEQNQSNFQANTYYNSQQNHMKGGQAASLKSQSSSSSSSSAPSSSSSSSTSSSSTSSSSVSSNQTTAASSTSTNTTQSAAPVTSNDMNSYVTNYAEYYNAAVAAHASSNGVPVNNNYGLVRAPSQPITAQPQLVAPKPVPAQQQTSILQNQNLQQPYTIYPNYFYLNPNVKPPPTNGIMPEYTINQNGTSVASNTSVVQLPAHYLRQAQQQQQTPVTYIQNQGPLTPLSYQHSGQFVNQQLYYAPPLPQMIQQQPQNNNEASASNQSNYTNSTITTAFETASNSTSSNVAQNTVGQSSSADNLDEIMRKNLTLQPQQSNEYYNQYAAQQQPAYFYITGSQPAAYQTIAMSPMTSQTNPNPVVHQMAAPNPQYYYYYASNNAQQGPITPQLQPVVPQIPTNSAQGGNLQQQPGAFVPMSQNTQLHSYPIQINTMNNGGNAAPLPGPHSTSLTTNSQQQQHQISFLTPHSNYTSQQFSQQSSANHQQLNTPVPLLQLPSISYLNQPQQLQSPKQQQQPGQYTQKTYQQQQIQSVNGSNMKQMNKTEYNNQQMQQQQSSVKAYNNNKLSNNTLNKNAYNNRFNTTKSYYKTNYANKNQSYSQTPVNSSNQLPQSDSLTVSNDTKTEIDQEVDAN